MQPHQVLPTSKKLEWQLREDCRRGNLENVRKLLLESGVDPNASDELGQTPLWIASFHGHVPILRLLLSFNAMADKATNKDGYTPLWVASQEGHAEVIALLLQARATPNVRSKIDGATPLYISAQKGFSDIVKLLLDYDADVDAAMAYGTTPLWIACQNGHTEVVSALLSGKRMPNMQAAEVNSAATPLYIAAQKGHAKIVELLLTRGAYVDPLTRDGATPLYVACQNGNFEVVRFLLQFSANLDLKYKGTGTPLMIAQQRGHKEIVELLEGRIRHNGGGIPLPMNGQGQIPSSVSNPNMRVGMAVPPKSPAPVPMQAHPSGVHSAPVSPKVPTPTSQYTTHGVPLSVSSPIPAGNKVNPSTPSTPAQHTMVQSPPKDIPTPNIATAAVGPSQPWQASSPKSPALNRSTPPSQVVSRSPVVSHAASGGSADSSPLAAKPHQQSSPPVSSVQSSPSTPISSSTYQSTPQQGPVASTPSTPVATAGAKKFEKVFVKVSGVNRRISQIAASSLEEFIEQIRANLNLESSEVIQLELFDDDAEEYFLLEKFTVFKDDNPITKIRVLEPESNFTEVDFESDDSEPRAGSETLQGNQVRGVRFGSAPKPSTIQRRSTGRTINTTIVSGSPVSRHLSSTTLRHRNAVSQSPSRNRMAEHRSMQVDSLNATLNIDVDTAEEDEGALLVDDRQFISYTDLEFVKKIGSGTFGDVFLGSWHGAKVAIKISRAITKKQQGDFLNEIQVMRSLQTYPHIVTLMGVCTDGEYPALVLEYCDGGTLEKYVQLNHGKLSDTELLRFAREISLGMKHLHKSTIIHRDLALRNVLLSGTTTPTCKISDFGLSRRQDNDRSHTDATTGLPIRWMAPESLDTRIYSTATDIWSYGMTLCEMITGRVPYFDIGDLDVGIKIRDTNLLPKLPLNAPPLLVTICKMCWNRDPAARPSFDMICDLLAVKYT